MIHFRQGHLMCTIFCAVLLLTAFADSNPSVYGDVYYTVTSGKDNIVKRWSFEMHGANNYSVEMPWGDNCSFKRSGPNNVQVECGGGPTNHDCREDVRFRQTVVANQKQYTLVWRCE